MQLVITPIPDGMRRCSSCDDVLPLGAPHFPRNKTQAGGHGYECTPCHRAQRSESQRRRKDARAVIHHRRRARLRGAKGAHSDRQWQRLKEKYGNRCLACGLSEPWVRLSRDHVVPLGDGPHGTNYITNIQPLCGICNVLKSNTYREYRPEYLLPERTATWVTS